MSLHRMYTCTVSVDAKEGTIEVLPPQPYLPIACLGGLGFRELSSACGGTMNVDVPILE